MQLITLSERSEDESRYSALHVSPLHLVAARAASDADGHTLIFTTYPIGLRGKTFAIVRETPVQINALLKKASR